VRFVLVFELMPSLKTQFAAVVLLLAASAVAQSPGKKTPSVTLAPIDPVSVTRTSYVHTIHSLCPSAYSYSYDDVQGLHACAAKVKFEVTFCP